MARPVGPNPLPHIISRQTGDNIVYFRQNLYRERLSCAKSLYKKDLLSHFGCVNAIEFSNDGDLLVSGWYNNANHILLFICEKHETAWKRSLI